MRMRMMATYLLYALTCICYLRNCEGARILGIISLNAKSHFVMYEGIMKRLADAGHQIDVVGHYPLEIPYANYTDIINLSASHPLLVNNVTYESMEDFNSIWAKTIIYITGSSTCALLELPEMQRLIKNPPTDPPYDLVLVEFIYANCFLAFGRHLKVPVVGLTSLHTSLNLNDALGNPLNPAIVSEIAERPISYMNFWQRLKNTMYILSFKLQSRYFIDMQNDIIKKSFGPEMPDVRQLEREVSLYLVNSHHIFHGVRPMTPAVVEVAGAHISDDNTPLPAKLKKWLDDSTDGCIYFSFGSLLKIESFPKSTIAEIYKAFSQIAPLRVVMKAASADELPPGIPENVLVMKWAPQVEILKHKNIRGFITHGGLMGTQEAVTFGVPLIAIPLFVDQRGNAYACAEREIAVFLEYRDLKADKIVSAVNAIVYDPKYKNNMNAISKQFLDRPLNARDTAVFWIEYILKHGSDSLRSPAVKLEWWQLALLDVYGSITVALLIVLYVLKLLLSAIFRRILYISRTSLLIKKKN